MRKMKTFQEMLNDGYEFPSDIDDATKQLITSFFCYREVASNKKFKVWFDRSLEVHYPYYLQLLRIDPTVSAYDWFVESYMERELTHEGSASGNDTSNTTAGGTSSRTFSSETSNTRTPDLTNTTANKYGSKQHETFNDTTTGNTTDNNQGFARAGALGRVAPMSESYTAEEMKANNSNKITVGKQSLSGYATGFPDMNIRNPSSTSDTLTTDGRLQEGTNEQTRKTNDADGNMVWRDGTDTTTNTVTGTDTNVTTNYSVKPDETVSSKTDHTTHESTSENESKDRERYAGRHQLPSDVIAKAKSVIASSTSWNYLYSVLDKCFLQTFDLDEEEE